MKFVYLIFLGLVFELVGMNEKEHEGYYLGLQIGICCQDERITQKMIKKILDADLNLDVLYKVWINHLLCLQQQR